MVDPCACEGYRAPASYGDVFTVLGEHGHIADDDVPTLIAMAMRSPNG